MSKKKKKKKKHIGLKIFLGIQIVLLGLVLAALGYYYGSGLAAKVDHLRDEAAALVANSTKDTFKREETGVAYDTDGKIISVLKKDKDVYYLEYDEIPVEVRQAIISIEDKKFDEHHGVDFKAITRAALSILRNNGEITQGGSTITQQLARNVFLTQKRTWERKVEEIYIALDLEKKYTKHDILEFYLNNVYFGNGYYGIEAAAQGYFRKDAVELDTSQIAFLCGLPNAPTRYDPRKHLDAAIQRRNRVLKNMWQDSILSRDEYNAAVDEEIKVKNPKQYYHNYMETFVYWCATRALMEVDGFEFQYEFADSDEKKAYQKRYDEEYELCNEKLYTGGYRIYTTLDQKKQKQLQQCINEGLSAFTDQTDKKIYKTQGAGVCIDNESGSVIAIVGGRSQKFKGYTLNRAYQSYRQPGSSIKPLIVYTPALENGYTADTVVNDHKFEGGPSNAGNSYHGHIKLSEAVQRSLNTVAWQIFDELTPKVGISYLYKMNFSNIVPSDETLAASLGGLTNGVSPLEMAKAYATIENDGAYRDPTCISRITKSDGTKVWTNEHEETVVYTQESARAMTQILQGVFTSPWGTARSLKIGEMPCAGKTGTTNDYKDGWFCGFTPYYTTAIWVGNDQPETIYGLQGASYPGHIWQNFMKEINEGLEVREFPEPVVIQSEDEEEPLDGTDIEDDTDTGTDSDEQTTDTAEDTEDTDASDDGSEDEESDESDDAEENDTDADTVDDTTTDDGESEDTDTGTDTDSDTDTGTDDENTDDGGSTDTDSEDTDSSGDTDQDTGVPDDNMLY